MTSPSSITGQPFGRYFLLKKLATGGMGEVFLAKVTGAAGFEKQLVIKKILPHLARNSTFVQRFIDEAKIVVQLHHGNIVQVIDMGVVDGEYFIAMEYVEGRDLRHLLKYCLIKERKIPPEITFFIISEVLKGLDYAHKKGDAEGRSLRIIHRDVSPSNILVSHEGNVKLVDFGIAKAADKLSESISGMLQGKFLYMSPEQSAGKVVDHRSDLFSVGTIAYEMLTGLRPFEGHSDLETLDKVKSCNPEPPSAIDADLSAEVDRFVMTALEKDPSRRYQSAEAFQMELMHYLYAQGAGVTPARVAEFFTTPLSSSRAQHMTLDDLINFGLSDSQNSGNVERTLTHDLPAGRPNVSIAPIAGPEDRPTVVVSPLIHGDLGALTPQPSVVIAPPRTQPYVLILVLLLGVIAALLGVDIYAQFRDEEVRWRDMTLAMPELEIPTEKKTVKEGPPTSRRVTRPKVGPVSLTSPRVVSLEGLPSSAKLFINGTLTEQNEQDRYPLPATGPVTLRVVSKHGKVWQHRLSETERVARLTVQLPVVKWKTVSVTVKPPDAVVEGAVNRGGLARVRLREGESRKLVVSKSGYHSATLTVRFSAKGPLSVTLLAKRFGHVKFRVLPASAVVKIGAHRFSAGVVQRVKLPVGPHTLRMTYAGKNKTVSFRIVDSRETVLGSFPLHQLFKTKVQ